MRSGRSSSGPRFLSVRSFAVENEFILVVVVEVSVDRLLYRHFRGLSIAGRDVICDVHVTKPRRVRPTKRLTPRQTSNHTLPHPTNGRTTSAAATVGRHDAKTHQQEKRERRRQRQHHHCEKKEDRRV